MKLGSLCHLVLCHGAHESLQEDESVCKPDGLYPKRHSRIICKYQGMLITYSSFSWYLKITNCDASSYYIFSYKQVIEHLNTNNTWPINGGAVK